MERKDQCYIPQRYTEPLCASCVAFFVNSQIREVCTRNQNTQFMLIDSIGKKIKVVKEVAQALSLTNVEALHQRVQDEKHKYDFVVTRAVMSLTELEQLVRKNISPTNKNAIQNGLICLKGGDLKEEVKPYKRIVEVYELTQYFSEPFFETKKLVYLPIG